MSSVLPGGRPLHNAIMLVSILPIAFAANIVRVIALVLITYHMGDAAGQGFLHGTAGMVLMLVALVFFFALDALLERLLARRDPPGLAPPSLLATGPAELPWWIALAGFAAMYLPLYWWAANGIWQSDEQGHGALILLVLLWLFWGLRRPIAQAPTRPAPAWGWSLFALGLLLYFVGQVVGIAIFMFGSQPFVVAGVLLLLRGPDAIRVAWFALFYFIFMIPLPGLFVDAVTGPLKQWISMIVVELLYHVGYPISRTGVVLTIGQYQMLVADACSGLHSMYSLSALGTLFMYIMARPSKPPPPSASDPS